ncbi:MAG: signal recognition particle-docking protein FtsY [Epulopiscium sp.]|nr:signal recognition particle-docking protein FtsY [Candidatus Epulonipiscium sp.]
MAFFNFFKDKKKQNEIVQQDAEIKQSESMESTVSENEDTMDTTIAENIPVEESSTITQEEITSTKNTCVVTQEENTPVEGSNAIIQEESTPVEELQVLPEPEEESLMVELQEESSSTDNNIESADNMEDTSVISPEKEKKGFFAKLIAGLDKTRKSILGGVDSVLGAFVTIDEDLFEELEEVLVMADIGVETTMNIIENLRKRVKKEKVTQPQDIKSMLIDEITQLLQEETEETTTLQTPAVILVIGVNGVGKTTTIGKLANNFKSQGKSVLLAAADTFRAAAIDQLEIWGQRSQIDVIKHQENSDPAAVVFDAVNAAKNRNTDVLICDTAGRLHNKKNLMDELKKISKVIDREYPKAHKEVYLVLDATTGQNALQQARLFQEVAQLTGIVLTKLDGTAKGGIVIAIKSELKIPVRYIGVGEGIQDLQQFHAGEFAKALFGDN